MRYSQTLIPTVKELPADAEILSHQLMIRSGMMRKLASGTYIYLPSGRRMILKIEQIIREEMNRTGAQEITMPVVQPMELWQRTGRDIDYGETLGKFIDRHGRGNVLSPTAEEGFTYLASCEIQSYKQLPMNLYQINTKYRDEFRPRFGALRSREFIMKDAYSFHATEDCLHKTYMDMYNAYCRVFTRCGLDYVIVQAETGEMGGTGSHQFTIPCDNGEDVIVYTADSSLAWNIEKAPVDPLPKQPPKETGPMTDLHTPNVGKIDEVCAFLKLKPQKMIKTIIFATKGIKTESLKNLGEKLTKHDGRSIASILLNSESPTKPYKLIAVLVRGDHEVNPEKMRVIVGDSVELAEEPEIIKLTGAAVGFAGPVGICDKADKVIIDHAVAAMAVGATGANKTDYHTVNVVPGRDFPLEGKNIAVADIRNAVDGDTYEGKKLLFKRGIEVGQVFKLGTKYSVKLEAKFSDVDGAIKPCLMGCYGIGVNRIIASAIETGNDADGMILPITIAPWEVIITTAAVSDDVTGAAEKIYKDLQAKGVEVLYDDRDLRAGVKFKDADLLGIPIRLTIGPKTLAEGKIELKLRREKDKKLIDLVAAADTAVALVQQLKDEIAKKL
ncbi:MAG: proline--tRNA ligase [Planctomycetes bacterium]|nr:proline--tRNA ligase [Planctomycetota bacterium]